MMPIMIIQINKNSKTLSLL